MPTTLETLPETVELSDNVTLHRASDSAFVIDSMVDLCRRAQGDEVFELEPMFKLTINAYVSLERSEISKRLHEKYEGKDPLLIGYVALQNALPVGFMSVGKCEVDWRKDDGTIEGLTEDEGINFGQWYVRSHRGRGIGTQVASFRLGLMRGLVSNGSHWAGRRPWTSIRQANSSSITITQQSRAFIRVGEQPKYENEQANMRRDVWLSKSDF